MDVDGVGNQADAADTSPDADIDCLEDEVECVLDDKPQKVIQGLYIGSAWAEMNKPALTKAGITDILQVAQGLFPRHPMLFTYFCLQVEDAPSTDLVRYFPKCFDFIDRAIGQGGSVLVHCAAGVSRSATIVLGYLMARHQYSLADALRHLKAVRPWVAPNPGFMQQLAAYEAAKCDLTEWKPWHLVWHEQQQEEQQRALLMGLAAVQQPPVQQQQQQQQWLSLPQPLDSSRAQQQQQQQQASVPAQPPTQQQCVAGQQSQACNGAAAALGTTCGGCIGSNGSSSNMSAASSLSHASLAGLQLPAGIVGSSGSNGPGVQCCGSNGGCGSNSRADSLISG